ncbi:SDR family oxidoreductase [Allohahella marinimesophila]|uniref:SDR family oxidoreductase n=1 Tax=Allohahella marinimesophila TaxID=1054972 RepID=A0ABP7NVX2_9GAMM
MTEQFKGKVALVTGGAAGIGRETAEAFARNGAQVVVSDVNAQAGEETASAIRNTGGKAIFIACDVSQGEQVEQLITGTLEAYGRLDFAFNNAGVEFEQGKLADGDEDTFDRIMDINVKGVWHCMRHEIKAMLAQGGGVIVNTASVAGLGAAPKMSIYSASKHAVIGFTKSAAVEYGKKGIRVNAVCPGVIDTEMFRRAAELDPKKAAYAAAIHPVGRIGQSSEIAAAVLYLCSEGAAFTTGVALPVDGGATSI